MPVKRASTYKKEVNWGETTPKAAAKPNAVLGWLEGRVKLDTGLVRDISNRGSLAFFFEC